MAKVICYWLSVNGKKRNRLHFILSKVFWGHSMNGLIVICYRLMGRATIRHHFILSKVFCSNSRSEALLVFSRLLSIHFFSSAFLVGRSDW